MQALEKSFRQEERHKTDRVILYRLEGESSFKPARVNNISHHGLFMLTAENLQIGEQAEVIISPYDSAFDPIQVTVEIVHIQQTSADTEKGYGCKVTSSNIIENIAV